MYEKIIEKTSDCFGMKRLSDIVKWQRGFGYRSFHKYDEEVSGSYLFLTLNNIMQGGGLKKNGWSWVKNSKISEIYFVKEGDIVITITEQSKDGSLLGSPAIVRFPDWYKYDRAVFSKDIFKLTFKAGNVDTEFMFYYLSFVQPRAKNYRTSTGVWNLKVNFWARDLWIPLPPLELQKKIAGILRTIDNDIDAEINYLEKARLLRETLLGHVIERLARGNWQSKRLREIATYARGTKPKHLYPQKVGDSYALYLTIEYMRDKAIPKYVNVNEGNFIKVEPDDIIMVWDGSKAGDVFTGFRGVLASTSVRIRCKNGQVDPRYLYYILLWRTRYLNKMAEGIAVKHVKRVTFENVLVPLPPLELQKKVAETLSMLDYMIEYTEELIERLRLIRKNALNLAMSRLVQRAEKCNAP